MQGEWLADFSLAEMYEKGEGVELNLIEAYAWYSISLVESDAQNAKVKLDEIEALLSKKDIELAQDKVLEISKNIKGIL
jgi:TPR repeat protein